MPGPVRRAAFKKKETNGQDLEMCRKGADGNWQPISKPKFTENKNFYRPSDLNDEEAKLRRQQEAKHAGFYRSLGEMKKKKKRQLQEQKRRAQMERLAQKIENKKGKAASQSRRLPEWYVFRLFSSSSAVAPRERRDSASIVATEIQRVVRGRASRLSEAEKALRDLTKKQDEDMEALQAAQVQALQEAVDKLKKEHQEAVDALAAQHQGELEKQRLVVEQIRSQRK